MYVYLFTHIHAGGRAGLSRQGHQHQRAAHAPRATPHRVEPQRLRAQGRLHVQRAGGDAAARLGQGERDRHGHGGGSRPRGWPYICRQACKTNKNFKKTGYDFDKNAQAQIQLTVQVICMYIYIYVYM